MKKEFILVAARDGAKIFERQAGKTGLRLVAQMEHPEGRMRNQDLVSDSPGRSFQLGRRARNEMGDQIEPREKALQGFARSLAEDLQTRFHNKAFDTLTIAAEPHLLGILRDAFGSYKTLPPIKEIRKDLYHFDTQDTGAHLEQ
jgi:protein required for attachment to host cells